MKKIVRLVAVLLCVCMLFTSCAPVGTNGEKTADSEYSQEVQNLEKLCKVWGYTKYNHPAFLFGEKDWDEELLNLIPVVSEAKEDEVNDILHEWFVSLGEIDYATSRKRVLPSEDQLIVCVDTSWVSSDYLGENLSADLQQFEPIPDIDREKQLFVFVSHGHYDHYKKEIFRLAEREKETYYILPEEIKIPKEPKVKLSEDRLILTVPGGEYEAAGCKIRTLRSTDEGVAYLVSYRGKRIYHAGDLNWWHWEEEEEPFNRMMRRNYQREIDKLNHMEIDAAFVPVDPRLGEQYCWGLDYFMRQTRTKNVFPMHFWGEYEIFDRLDSEACTEAYRERMIRIEREGQIFDLER